MRNYSITRSKPEVNVSNKERIISAIAGGWLLSSVFSKSGNKLVRAGAGALLLYRALSGHCPVYGIANKRRLPDPVRNINVRNTTIVNRPRNEVYEFWREMGNFPLFMKHLRSVETTSDGFSHWEADIPGVPGIISWDAAIVKEVEGELLAWHSLPGATVDNAGKVEFADAGEGRTEVTTVITYRAPLGVAGEGLGRALNPLFENMIQEELENFTTYMEVAV